MAEPVTIRAAKIAAGATLFAAIIGGLFLMFSQPGRDIVRIDAGANASIQINQGSRNVTRPVGNQTSYAKNDISIEKDSRFATPNASSNLGSETSQLAWWARKSGQTLNDIEIQEGLRSLTNVNFKDSIYFLLSAQEYTNMKDRGAIEEELVRYVSYGTNDYGFYYRFRAIDGAPITIRYNQIDDLKVAEIKND